MMEAVALFERRVMSGWMTMWIDTVKYSQYYLYNFGFVRSDLGLQDRYTGAALTACRNHEIYSKQFYTSRVLGDFIWISGQPIGGPRGGVTAPRPALLSRPLPQPLTPIMSSGNHRGGQSAFCQNQGKRPPLNLLWFYLSGVGEEEAK